MMAGPHVDFPTNGTSYQMILLDRMFCVMFSGGEADGLLILNDFLTSHVTGQLQSAKM